MTTHEDEDSAARNDATPGARVIGVAEMMGIVCILALGALAYRIDLNDWRVYRLYHELVIGCVPMACLLAIGLIHAGLDISKRGRCSSFLLGFEAAGWMTLLAYAAFMAVNFENGRRPIFWLMRPTAWFFPGPGVDFQALDVVALQSAIILIPQLGFAFVGGIIAAASRLAIVRLPKR